MDSCAADTATLVAPTIESVIADRAVRTVFQPVVHLASKAVVGFEALSRGPAGTSLESPLALIDAAAQAGLAGELDWLCRAQAMQAAADANLPDEVAWLINVEPAGLAMECPAHLLPSIEVARTELRIILEVVERGLDGHVVELIRATDQARRDAWGVALDDVGAVESSLALLPFLRPDVVKLDMSLVRSVPTEEAAVITAAVRSYAERKNAVILAEGIETADHERLAVVFGATYGQGYYFGRPGSLPASLPTPTRPIPIRQHLDPIDGRSPFELLAEQSPRQRGTATDLLHIKTYMEQQAAQGSHASVVLAGFHSSEYFTVADRARYDQLARANALTVILADGLSQRREPGYHIGGLRPDSAMAGEWVIIVLGPHSAAAFAVRENPTASSDGGQAYDFVYTFQRDAVIDAARRFVQELVDGDQPADAAATPEGSAAAARSAQPAPQRRRLDTGGASADWPSRGTRAAPVPAALRRSDAGFRAASRIVLDYLNANMPMGVWTITRVANDRQTYLLVDGNDYGVPLGGSHLWDDSYCVHMAAGTGPRVAPDAAAVPVYAAARVNDLIQIGAYAGAPILEPDGSLFGAICGLDSSSRTELTRIAPVLDTLSELLCVALAGDRAVQAAHQELHADLITAKTDRVTGTHNRAAWAEKIALLDADQATYGDPTVVVMIDLDDLTRINRGTGGYHAGDRFLREAAAVLRRSIRSTDFLARLDGGLFGIVAGDTPAAYAPVAAHRLARALERAGAPASVGWAPLEPYVPVQSAVDRAVAAMHSDNLIRRVVRAVDS